MTASTDVPGKAHHVIPAASPRRRVLGRRYAPAATGIALVLLMTACSEWGALADRVAQAEFNAAETSVVNPSDQAGGTLRYALAADFDSPDPGNTYYAFSWNFTRYYARTLLTYASEPGKGGIELVPDLAAEMPRPNDDATEWTLRLQKGLRYEDGTTITAEDVKYAIARSNFDARELTNGPTYFRELLANSDDYRGPHATEDEPLAGFDGIETPDEHTLVFHLNRSFAEFPYVLVQPQTAPVPAEADQGERYQDHVLSSGPYKFDGKYRPGDGLDLKRNKEWDPRTDPARPALPDRVEVDIGIDQNEIDQRLVNGEVDIDLAGVGLGPAMKDPLITDENLRPNVDNPQTSTLRYMNISTVVEPLDDVACRRAIMYAADRKALQQAWGGDTGGDIATQIMPPTLPGTDPSLDPYPSKDNSGDLAAAREELEKCGRPDGFSTSIGTRADHPGEVSSAEALQQALARVGIETEIKQYPSDSFTNTQAAHRTSCTSTPRPDRVRLGTGLGQWLRVHEQDPERQRHPTGGQRQHRGAGRCAHQRLVRRGRHDRRRRGTRIDLHTDRRASPGRGRDSARGVRTHGDVSPTASDQRVPPRGLLHVRLHVLGHHP